MLIKSGMFHLLQLRLVTSSEHCPWKKHKLRPSGLHLRRWYTLMDRSWHLLMEPNGMSVNAFHTLRRNQLTSPSTWTTTQRDLLSLTILRNRLLMTRHFSSRLLLLQNHLRRRHGLLHQIYLFCVVALAIFVSVSRTLCHDSV